jgi:eukaryotic-like serine/threonine-protein kinase
VTTSSAVATVPDVRGELLKDARKALHEAHYDVHVDRVNSSAGRAGTVLEQAPPAHAPLGVGQTVTLTVPSAPALVAVPYVAGLRLKVAEEKLHQDGLEVGGPIPEDSPFDAGIVIRTEPVGGERRSRGTRIDLYVASGKNVVPDVTGMTEGDARAAVIDAGFEPRVIPQESDKVPALVVIDQDPRTGEPAKLGSVVDLTVAVAPASQTATPTPSETPEPPTPTPSPLSPSDGAAGLRAP